MKIDIHFNSEQLNNIERKVDSIMATQKDLDNALDTLATAVSDAANRVSADMAALQAKIDAIPNAPDLSAEVAKVQAGIDALKNIDPASPTPVQPTGTTPPPTA